MFGSVNDTYLKLLDILIDFQSELQNLPLEGLELDKLRQASQN